MIRLNDAETRKVFAKIISQWVRTYRDDLDSGAARAADEIAKLLPEKLTVYQVMANSDMTEGRGPMRVVATFLHEDDAWATADSMTGVMGRRPQNGTWRDPKSGGDVTVRPIEVLLYSEEYKRKLSEAAKAAALVKLNDADKRALGLL